jgi:outer membrane receptor protein involved in Fe transport
VIDAARSIAGPARTGAPRLAARAALALASAAAATAPVLAQPAAGGALPEVVVAGKREISTATRLDEDPLRLPFSAHTVDRGQIDDVGARSLEDAMRSVPGLQHGTQGNYFTRFEVRGLRDTQDVLVLVDGVPLRLLQGNADLTLLAPDLIDRIELIKGPASALYGRNAIGGVAQFFMEPAAPGGSASLTAGSDGLLGASLRSRWSAERSDVFVGLSRTAQDGFQRGTDRDQTALVLGADHAMTGRWTTGLQAYATRVKALRGSIIPLRDGRPMFGISQRDNFAIPGVFIEGDYASLAWRNRVRIADSLTLDHLSSVIRYDRLFQGGITIVPPPAAVTKGYAETDTADRGVFHDVSLTHRSRGDGWFNTLQAGFNLESAWQDQASPSFTGAPTYRGPDYDRPVSNVNTDPRGIRGPVTGSRFDQRVTSVYLQDRIEIGALGLTAGLRHDRFEQTLARDGTAVAAAQSGSRTSPRVGIDWSGLRTADARHAVFSNAGEGFRPQAVALNTRDGVVVPALLRPEVTRSVEVGIKGRADDERWTYQAALFQADKIDGQRSFRTGPESFVFSNATSRVRGLESQVQARLSAAWRGYLHYTLQDARLRDFPTFDNAGRPSTNFAGYRVRMSARHIAGAGLTWTQGAWNVTTTVNHVGSRPLRDNVAQPQSLPAYTLVNIAVAYRLTASLTLQAGIDNLTDRYYIADDLSAQEAGNAGAPRTAFARVRYTF